MMLVKQGRKSNIAKQRRKAAVYVSVDSLRKDDGNKRPEDSYEIHQKHTEAIDQIYLEMPALNNIRELKKDINGIQKQILRSEILSKLGRISSV